MEGNDFMKFHFYCYKILVKAHKSLGSKGQILRSGEIPESKDSLCSLKKRECVMS